MYSPWGTLGVGVLGIGGGFLLAMFLVWSVVWKGFALWRAAKQGSRGWFIALLIVNTAGILEILYLYVFSKKNFPSSK